MLQRTEKTNELIVLRGITPTTFAGINEAIGECHARMTYDGYRLELRNPLHGVNPVNYGQFLQALNGCSIRHTFDQGSLEMMSPRKDHDWVKGFLGRIVEATANELNTPLQGICSTTLTNASLKQGLEPDESYYIANEPAVRGKDDFEPDVDPPPDLVIEVEVTHAAIPRLPLFAELGVPEVWRHAGGEIELYALQDGQYEPIERSLSFPFLSAETLKWCLDNRYETHDTAAIRMYLKWLRTNPEVPPPRDDEF